MYVPTTDLDGRPLGQADLCLASDGRLLLDEQVVMATRVLGSRTALLILSRQVCVPTADYVRVRTPPKPVTT